MALTGLAHKTLRSREARSAHVAARILGTLIFMLVLVLLLALWALGWAHTQSGRARGPEGGSASGLALGVIAVVLYAFAAAYAWRRRHRSHRHGTTRIWQELHLAFGVLAGVAALLHAGPRLGAPLHGSFLVAWELLVLSGVAGKLIGVLVPPRLTRLEEEALLLEDVVERHGSMCAEIERLLQSGSPDAAEVVRDRIPRAIRSPDWYGARRLRRSTVVDAVFVAIDGEWLLARGFVPADQRAWLMRLVACHVELAFLERMWTWHVVLRAWVPVHVALTTVCLPWLLFHMVTAFLV